MKFHLHVILGACLLSSCKTNFKPEPVTYEVQYNEAQLAEGRKLTISMCGPCHYDPATKKLTGMQQHDLPKIAGKIYSRNITQHPEKGIANYSAGEIAYLMRTGIAKDGSLMSYMQRPNLADTDLKAIIVFLRSSDELVTPSATEPPETDYTAFGKFGIAHFPGPLKYPDKVIPKPDRDDDPRAYGKYLIDNLACYHCHSKSFFSVDELEPEKSKGYMAGGQKLKNPEGESVASSNLTFHETGLAGWTEDEFRKAVKEGVRKDSKKLRLPMPVYPELSDADVNAIYLYLSGIPKIKNKVERD